MFGPILQGDRLSLEPPRLDDIPLFCDWFAHLEVTRTLLMRFVPSLQQEEEWFKRTAQSDAIVYWVMRVDGRTVGASALEEIDWINRHAGSGTIIGDPADWGKGYASEATRLRTDYAFQELGLERLETQSFAENSRMHRALEKSGYQMIGRRRRYVYKGGEWHDSLLFELLRDDWQARRP